MAHGMVFLGFGKYVRADRIYALEEIEASTVPWNTRRRTGRGSLTMHPQLFEGE